MIMHDCHSRGTHQRLVVSRNEKGIKNEGKGRVHRACYGGIRLHQGVEHLPGQKGVKEKGKYKPKIY